MFVLEPLEKICLNFTTLDIIFGEKTNVVLPYSYESGSPGELDEEVQLEDFNNASAAEYIRETSFKADTIDTDMELIEPIETDMHGLFFVEGNPVMVPHDESHVSRFKQLLTTTPQKKVCEEDVRKFKKRLTTEPALKITP